MLIFFQKYLDLEENLIFQHNETAALPTDEKPYAAFTDDEDDKAKSEVTAEDKEEKLQIMRKENRKLLYNVEEVEASTSLFCSSFLILILE